MSEFFKKYSQFLLLLCIGVLCYMPSLFGSFLWDDEQFIYKNQYVEEFNIEKIFTSSTTAGAGLTSNYYRPLTTLSFALDHLIWGFQPFGFHLTNMVFHILSGLVLFLFLKNSGLSKNNSFIISLFFLTHPLQTEAVAYANSRGDSLYAFYAFLSLFFFSQLLKNHNTQFSLYNLKIKLSTGLFSLLTIISALFSFLSKEIGISIAGLLFLTFAQNYITSKSSVSNFLKKNKLALGTFSVALVATAGYVFLRFTVLQFQEHTNPYPPGDIYGDNLSVRLFTFSKVFFIYLRLILLPFGLHMERLPNYVETFNWWPISAITVCFLILLLGFKQIQKSNQATILLGLFWFLGGLLPVSGIIPVNGVMYEHWLYVPLVGFCICVAGLLHFFKISLKQTVSVVACCILIPIYILLSWRQMYIWSDPIRLYSYTLQFSETTRLRNNLGMELANRGYHQEALEQYQAALKISSQYPQVYFNAANTYRDIGEHDQAIEYYKVALEKDSNFTPALSSLFVLYLYLDMPSEATQLKNELEEKQPTHPFVTQMEQLLL